MSAHNNASSKSPKAGDLIEIDRGMYQHWVVYIGYGEVVHFGTVDGTGSSGSLADSHGEVRRDRLVDVVQDCDWRVNNSKDSSVKPRLPEEIVKAALAAVGKKMRYNLTDHNCEHFATEMRYGKAMSTQVRKAEITGSAVLGVSGLASPGIYGSSALGSSSSLMSRCSKNK